jgi:hypothetical protein
MLCPLLLLVKRSFIEIEYKRALHSSSGEDGADLFSQTSGDNHRTKPSASNHTPLTIGFVDTDWRRLRGRTPPVGSLRSFAGLSASCR